MQVFNAQFIVWAIVFEIKTNLKISIFCGCAHIQQLFAVIDIKATTLFSLFFKTYTKRLNLCHVLCMFNFTMCFFFFNFDVILCAVCWFYVDEVDLQPIIPVILISLCLHPTIGINWFPSQLLNCFGGFSFHFTFIYAVFKLMNLRHFNVV